MAVEIDAELREILGMETFAVVGCSSTPGKAAHDVPRYMQEQGYRIVPVNPTADTVLGERAYDSLSAVPDDAGLDVVNVFRPSEEVAGIVDETLDREDVTVVWTQRGIRDDEAAHRVEAAGRRMVQDRCVKVEHQRLLG